MGKYELSIAEDYVASWGIVEAVREFFQNSLDQQIVNPQNKMVFNYNEEEQCLTVGNLESVLETKTLLLGVTTKKDDNSTIGQFGEGYKIATLVALREGKEVTIYNYGKKEVWRPRLVNSRRYQAKVLTFFTEKYVLRRVPNYDLIIEIKGITPEEYQRIKTHNLHLLEDIGEVYEVEEGRILLDAKFKGQLFVNGLFVKQMEELHYGYDIKAQYLKLDRDRRAVSSFDTQWTTSKMWLRAPKDKTIELVMKGVPDVSFVGSQCAYSSSTFADLALQKFRDLYGQNAIPVFSQNQMEHVKQKYEDAEAIIVTEGYYKLIRASSSYSDEQCVKKELTKEQQLLLWMDGAKEVLSYNRVMKFYEILGIDADEAYERYQK